MNQLDGKKIKYAIASDWHISSRVSNTDKIIYFLENLNCENLILNGDILDSNKVQRFTKKQWKILNLLRKLSKSINIYWTEANHDNEIAPIICEFLGIEFVKELSFKINNKKFIVLHGHNQDHWISKKWLTEFFTGLYYLIQCIDKKRIFTIWIKKKSKQWLKVTNKLKEKAFKIAKIGNYQIIILSHTHYPEEHFEDNILYMNSGSFSENLCHYILIDKFGNCKLEEI